jgi:hypothetical protein
MMTPHPGDDTSADAREAKVESLQAVVDRVVSWQEGATEGTVREELDKALDEVGLDLDEPTRERIVEHVHEGGEHVDVRGFLS